MKECCGAIKKKAAQQVLAHKDLHNLVLTGVLYTELRNSPWDIRLCNTHSFQDLPHFLQTCFKYTSIYIDQTEKCSYPESRGQKGFSHISNVKQASLR